MQLVHGISFAIFLLIFAYLSFNNSAGVASILNAAGTNIGSVSKVLQGR